ncbi:MAG: PDZ domain-containing protein, partial [Vicinamibacterales bacterium]
AGRVLAVLAFLVYFAVTAAGDLIPLEHFGAVFAIGADAGEVTTVAPGSPADRAGIRPGDRILTIDGRAVRNTLDWAVVYARIHEGQPIDAAVLRAGRTQHLEVRFDRRSDGSFATAERRVVLLSRAAQLITLVFGVVILVKARGVEALLGFWLLATVGVYSVGLPPRMAAVWRQFPVPVQVLFYLPSVSKAIIGVILLLFFRVLLRRPLTDRTGLIIVSAGLACVAWELPFITALVYRPHWLPALTPFLPLVVGVNLAAVAMALVMLARHYGALEDPQDRRRLRWILAGSILGLSTGAPTVAGLWLGVNDPTLIYDTPPGLQVAYTTFLIMPASFWWAIARRQLFDIEFVVRRGVHYLFARRALLVMPPVTLALVVVEGGLHRDDPLIDLARRHVVVYACLAIGLIVFSRWRETLLDGIDRRLFRERYDAAQLLKDLVSELRTARDLVTAAQVAVGQVSTALHPEWLAVHVGTPGDLELRCVAGRTAEPAWPRGSGLLAALWAHGAPMDVHQHSRAWASMNDADRGRVSAGGVHLMVPIGTCRPGDDAVLMLGPKRSGEPYGQEDCTLLHAVGVSLGALGVPIDADDADDAAASPPWAEIDLVWEARLRRLADAVASGETVDWSLESDGAADDRRLMLMELQSLERLMDAHGASEAIRATAQDRDDDGGGLARRWGRFELRDLLGRGRLGSVYR